ncbi:MAG: membrane-bound O-acyltransferase family protein [Desulfobacterium sp.]|nr:membrane-bound O-acyltransferase family protein [Desulfobacterium sp.]
MQFISLHYFVFFSIVAIGYFYIPQRFRWMLLLSANYYFYMCWKPEYALLIIASTLVAYITGKKMGSASGKKDKKKYLIVSLLINLGILFGFKYFNFFNDSFRAFFTSINIFYNVPAFHVLLPVGISFYTFQALSYSIEVYRGNQKPENHFGIFALYVSFFPQLLAGPIERPTNMLPQFHEKYKFDYERITNGIKLIAWGIFKKVVIADRLAVCVNQVYNAPQDHPGLPLIIATYFFAFQIYCDFSGYTDIAIGSAQILGFRLMENFRQPYFSTSVSEFWRRWHISLSTWFRDYLYIPLGGNRTGKTRFYCNIFLTFVISGLWHGANWTFVIWGSLHGLYVIIGRMTYDIRKKIAHRLHLHHIPGVWRGFQILITFHLVLFAWIFFRANSLTDAMYIISHLFSSFDFQYDQLGLDGFEFKIAILFLLIMEFTHILQEKDSVRKQLSKKPFMTRWSAYYLLVMTILLFGNFGESPFVYFQF